MFTIEIEREEDGRWIAEVVDLPGVIAYGESRQQAIDRVQALSLRVLADRLEHGEGVPDMAAVFAVAPRADSRRRKHAGYSRLYSELDGR